MRRNCERLGRSRAAPARAHQHLKRDRRPELLTATPVNQHVGERVLGELELRWQLYWPRHRELEPLSGFKYHGLTLGVCQVKTSCGSKATLSPLNPKAELECSAASGDQSAALADLDL
jgi:hypothetical protein